MHRSFLILSMTSAMLLSCNGPQDDLPAPLVDTSLAQVAPAPPAEIDNYARRFINALQPISIAGSREYCGYFVQGDDGLVRGTQPLPGTADSCTTGFVPDEAVASYHTHGAYLPDYFNEYPSVTDVESAVDVDLDDYVGTPGGRLWRIDGTTGLSTTVCDNGCVLADPNYVAEPGDPAKPSYTVNELRKLQN